MSLIFARALIQYNSATASVSTNARLRWEYQAGSELFVVYNEDRNTSSLGVRGLSTRSIIVKVNRLFHYRLARLRQRPTSMEAPPR